MMSTRTMGGLVWLGLAGAWACGCNGSDVGLEPMAHEGGSGGAADACEPGTTQSCYDGGPATPGVGICHAGEQVCSPEGVWGPCEDQQLPLVEDCTAPGDEDCDGVGCSELVWSLTTSDPGSQSMVGAAVARDGSIVIAGRFYTSLELAPGHTLVSNGNRDVFVAKLSADGQVLWSRQFGDEADQVLGAMALDPDDNIVLVGSYQGAIDFGGEVLQAPATVTDVFIAKLDSDGAHVGSSYLTYHASGSAEQNATGAKSPLLLGVDEDGTIAVGGSYTGHWGGVCFPDCPTPADGSAGFVAKFRPDLQPFGYHSLDGPGDDAVTAMAFVGAGELQIAGQFDSQLDLGSGVTLAAVGNQVGFIAQLDINLAGRWAERLGAAKVQYVWDMLALPWGDAAVVGGFESELITTTETWASDGLDGFFAISAGTGLSGTLQAGGPGAQALTTIARDSSGAFLVAGLVGKDATIDLGGGPLDGPTGLNFSTVLAKLNADGGHTWSKSFGTAAQVDILDIGTTADDRIVVAGQFVGTIDLGSGPVGSMDPQDRNLFVAVYQP